MSAVSDFEPLPWATSGSLPQQWHRFTLARARGVCECCGAKVLPTEVIQAHHVVRQQDIRERCKQLGHSADATERLLWDTRNGMALREDHHRLHTRQVRKVPQAALRPEHWEFARQLGLAHRLENQYAA